MKRVLVVEDEASIREMVALNLKMAGWEVVEAPSAERALELMHSGEHCDAALLDIMLPGMDGLSLCETIRRGDSDIGIIIVSAKGQESDKIRGLSIGADDYITKPFSVSELIARLEALTRRIHRGSGTAARPAEEPEQLVGHFVCGGPAEDGNFFVQRVRVPGQQLTPQLTLFAQQRFGIERVMEAVHGKLLL